jgi:GPH family glycoside/pentoside/hexuronide:cation symporter
MIVVNPSWGLPVVFTLAALAGVGIGAVHVLPWSMIPDAVEWDEYETGQRHEGMFYSLVTLLRKIASSIAVPMIPLVLKLTHFRANDPVQPVQAIHGIQALMGPVPSFFLLMGILFAVFYPLGRERHAEIRAQIAARRLSQPASD